MTVIGDFDLIPGSADDTFDEDPFVVTERHQVAGTELRVRNGQDQILLFQGGGHGIAIDDIAGQETEEGDGPDQKDNQKKQDHAKRGRHTALFFQPREFFPELFRRRTAGRGGLCRFIIRHGPHLRRKTDASAAVR